MNFSLILVCPLQTVEKSGRLWKHEKGTASMEWHSSEKQNCRNVDVSIDPTNGRTANNKRVCQKIQATVGAGKSFGESGASEIGCWGERRRISPDSRRNNAEKKRICQISCSTGKIKMHFFFRNQFLPIFLESAFNVILLTRSFIFTLFQSYKEAKAHRQNKIKSKQFHRIQRKAKIKQQLKEFEQLRKSDPQAALLKLEELEKTRAEERMSLRHKSTGQWAKNKQVRAKYDKDVSIKK